METRMASLCTCAVCLGGYKDPRYLVCGHQFCKECLSRIARNTTSQHIMIKCPTCRRSTKFKGRVHALPKPKVANNIIRQLRHPIIAKIHEMFGDDGACRKCKMCSRGYADPRQLFCGDQFCRECLQGIFTRECGEGGDVIDIRCPTCSRTTRFKGNIAALPRPYLANELMELHAN